MNVICTGGRDYYNESLVMDVLDALNPDEIFVGDAPGLDYIVTKYAEEKGINLHVFYADWDGYGKAAGPIRNREMLESATNRIDYNVLVAFPGGKGTENCIKQAKSLGLVVLRVEE